MGFLAILYKNFLLKKIHKSEFYLENFFFTIYILYLFFPIWLNNSITTLYPMDEENVSHYWGTYNNEAVIGFMFNNTCNCTEQEKKYITTNIMKDLFSINNNYKIHNFKDEKEMKEYSDNNDNLIAFIKFNENLFNYEIGTYNTDFEEGSKKFKVKYKNDKEMNEVSDPLLEKQSKAYLRKFTYLQSIIDKSIINIKTKKLYNIDINVGNLFDQKKDEPAITTNNIGMVISMFIMYQLYIIDYLIREKDNNINEGLVMIGVRSNLLLMSWKIAYIIMLIIVVSILYLICIFLRLYKYINPILIFISILLFGIISFDIAIIFAITMKKYVYATFTCLIFSIFQALLYYCNDFLSEYVKLVLGLFFPVLNFINIFKKLINYELNKIKFKPIYVFQDGIIYYYGVFLFSIIFYTLLEYILEYFMDEYSEYNLKRKPKIFVEDAKNYYYKQDIEKYNRWNEECVINVSDISKLYEKVNYKSKKNQKPSKFKFLKKLEKEPFYALKHINLKIYNDEIFAVLGHNGSGKTTLLKTMIGLLNPSNGKVYFNGEDLHNNNLEIRKDFGICPQTNLLYDELTVENHIKIFSMIKNIKVDIDQVLKEVGLENKKQDIVRNLSGGQKRLLCIAIAFIGDPKYVFLDEPTSGLDLLSRRNIWNLLLRKKKGKVIIFTTHYMDEADIVADRKLILNHGKIRCLGSSSYLKSHFNMYYNFNIESDSFELIDKIIKKYIPDSIYTNKNDKNQNYILSSITSSSSSSPSPSSPSPSSPSPSSSSSSSKNIIRTWKLPLSSSGNLSKLFSELKVLNQEKNVIKSYSLHMPTLEELYLHIENEDLEENEKLEMDNINNNNHNNYYHISDNRNLIEVKQIEQPKLKKIQKLNNINQIKLLIKYRINFIRKNIKFISYAILLPQTIVGITFFILGFIYPSINYDKDSRLDISTDLYKNFNWNINENETNIPNFAKEYKNIINNNDYKYNNNNNNNNNYNITNYNGTEIYENYEENCVSSVTGILSDNATFKFNINYNISMDHALPVTINLISNSFLALNNITERIKTKTLPSEVLNDYSNEIHSTFIIISIGLGAAFLSGISSFGVITIREMKNQIYQQLKLKGISNRNYWISAIITDSALYSLTSLLILILAAIEQPEIFLNHYVIIVLFISLIICSISSIIYQYFTCNRFQKGKATYSWYPFIYIVVQYFYINIFASVIHLQRNGNLLNIFSKFYLVNIFITILVCPNYAIIQIIVSIYEIDFYSKYSNKNINLEIMLRLSSSITVTLMISLINIPIYLGLLALYDKKNNKIKPKFSIKNHKPKETKNKDVYNEYLNVKNNYKDYEIAILNLRKKYKISKANYDEGIILKNKNKNERANDIYVQTSLNKVYEYIIEAVKDVTFGVKKNECFGLLGINGSGKSTILDMISTYTRPTTGIVYYNGVEYYKSNLKTISLGYCPQNNTYWKELTVRDHVEYILSVQGYSPEDVKKYATQYISYFRLQEDQDTQVVNLSEGTKRKLCLLVAFIGNPEKIILDEPTANLDPSSRIHIWNIIKEYQTLNQSTIILTTHSIEEAEYLCDRIAILNDGNLVCIGTPEDIKKKYGNNYNLEVQSNDIEKFHQKIIEEGGGGEGGEEEEEGKERGSLIGNNYKKEYKLKNRINYEIPIQDIQNLEKFFEIMENCKRKGMITDYNFGQMSLEQIFIKIAKNEEDSTTNDDDNNDDDNNKKEKN